MNHWKLAKIKKRIVELGECEFSHNTVMELITEIERLQKYEQAVMDIKDTIDTI